MPEITSLSQLDPNGYYTYQDYITWKLQERVELFLGKVFKMSPAPNVKHQRISRNVMFQMELFFRKNDCQIFHAPFDVRLPISKNKEKSDTVVQPDIVVICDGSKLDEQGCNGAPDIVLEILSPGNTRKEVKDKFDLYEASLVPEYWIVDPERQSIVIYSLNNSQKYIGSKPLVIDEKVISSVIDGLEIDVVKIFEGS